MTAENPHTVNDGNLFDDAAFRRDCETLCDGNFTKSRRPEWACLDLYVSYWAESCLTC